MANWDWISGKDGTVVVVMYVKRKYLHDCWYMKHVFTGHKRWVYSLQHHNAENEALLQSRPIQWIQRIWCRLGVDFCFILVNWYVLLGHILGLLVEYLVVHGKYLFVSQQLTRRVLAISIIYPYTIYSYYTIQDLTRGLIRPRTKITYHYQ